MPTVRKSVTATAPGAEVPLGPFNRFGGRGGAVRLKATQVAAGTSTITLQIGSDVVIDRGLIGIETAVNLGPTEESPVLATAVGAPGDPIVITLFGTDACIVQADITNL